MAKKINSSNFEQEVLKSDKAILVDFWATWCGPCMRQAPALEELCEAGYAVGKIDVDECPELAGAYGVMSIPTLIVFKDGKEQTRLVGLQSKDRLEAVLKQYSR